jgi:hypothetical protein
MPRKFVGHPVQVEIGGDPPAPVRVIDGERRWDIVRVDSEWHDTGHGALAVRARTWRTRRHRKGYLLIAADGARLQIYLDYARADKYVWQLVAVQESDQ